MEVVVVPTPEASRTRPRRAGVPTSSAGIIFGLGSSGGQYFRRWPAANASATTTSGSFDLDLDLDFARTLAFI